MRRGQLARHAHTLRLDGGCSPLYLLAVAGLDAEAMSIRAGLSHHLLLFVALLALAPQAVQAQSREISGRLEAVWGMLPSLEGGPRMKYFVHDDAERRSVEVRFTEGSADRFGSATHLNGKRVRLLVNDEVSSSGGVARVVDVRSAATDVSGRWVPDLSKPLEDRHHSSAEHGAGQVIGSRKYLTILCKFSGNSNEPGSNASYDAFFMGASMSVASYWGEVSENRLNFTGSQVVGWLTLPHDSSYYFPIGATDADLTKLADDCTAAADAQVNFTQFDGVIVQFNGSLGCCGWGGSRTLSLDGQTKSYGFVWLPPHGYPPRGVGFVSHEVGHSLGLPHSGGPYGRTYDSKWDVMSSAHAYLDAATQKSFGATTVAYHKLLLEWIPASRTFVPTAPVSSVIIERLTQSGPSNFQTAIVPIRGTADYYTIESRRRIGYDAMLPLEGVIIHHVKPTGREEPAWVVDADGDGDPNDDGAVWVPGETYVDVPNQISITVDSLIGSAYKVTIRFGGTRALALGSGGKSTTVTAGAAAAQDSVTVTPAGPGVLAWTASKQNGRGSWLEFVTASGTGNGVMRLRRNPAGLGVGTYVDTVLVSLSGADTQRFVDTLVVSDGGASFLGLSVRSRYDSLLYYNGLRDSAMVLITGAGAASTAWTATKKRATTALMTGTGTGPGFLKWTRNAFGHAVGVYIDTITVTADGNPALTAAIVDTFRVLDHVAMTTTPRSRRDSMPEGAPPQLDSTIVTMAGHWATDGQLRSWTYYWERAGKFLRLGRNDPDGYQESRTGNATVYWTRGPRSLTPGTYIDTLTICGPYCWFEDPPAHAGFQYFVDTLKVYASALALAASPTSRRDTTALGMNISKDSVQILVTGSGWASTMWTATSRTGASILVSEGAFNDPGTGTGTGWLVWTRNLASRSAGTYVDTLVVTAPGVTGSVKVYDTVVVMPPAVLVVSAAGRRPILQGAPSVPDSIDVNIFGSAGGATAWTATKRAAFTTLNAAGGTGSGRLRLTRNSSAFTIGQLYVDTIIVSAAGAFGGSVQIIDSLDAIAGSLLALNLRTRRDSAGLNVAGAIRDSVEVTLSGTNGATTVWSAAKRGAWTTILAGGGTGSGFLKWTRSNVGLALGTYVDTLTVTATGAFASPLTVIDTFRVVPSASIALSSASRRDSIAAGSATAKADSITITLSGAAASTTEWTATKKRASTTLTTGSGTGSGKLRWTRSAASLVAGTYVDTITVTAAASGATARVVIDTLLVRPPTTVSLTAAIHNVGSIQGGNKAKGDSALVTLSGFAASSTQWTATKSAAWLTLTSGTGGTAQRVRWARNQTGLAVGTYVDTIRLSIGGSAATASIVDTLRVIAVPGMDPAKHLIGTTTLSLALAQLLDHEGNADGILNLGDVLAHLDRTGTVLTSAVMASLASDAEKRDSTTVRATAPARRQP
jgi:M6 family metalloprotease-like protein